MQADAHRSLADDDFLLFSLPRQFALDDSALDAAWRQWMAGVHPDRHAAGSAVDQRLAAQWATRINEAYRRLKDPVRRAAYLCELHGVPVSLEGSKGLSAAFLMQQMAWREALEEAEAPPALEAIEREVASAYAQHLETLRVRIDGAQSGVRGGGEPPIWAEIAEVVRGLMFFQRFRRDLRDRLDQLDSRRD